MRNIEEIKKEYTELSGRRMKHLQEAEVIYQEMLRLEGEARAYTPNDGVEEAVKPEVVTPEEKPADVIEGEVITN